MRFWTSGFLLVAVLSFHTVLIAQADSSYSFIAAGHAYGSHDGENMGLHPALLHSLYAGIDSTAEFIVFTGDIVNHSTEESWLQVEDELDSLSLPYYYVMGNHDDNEIGRQFFLDKYGTSYYTFYSHNDLFIVLNSIEADRAISENQLVFLEEQIAQASDSVRNIFIFFHEIIWNSHKKYIDVRSNNRSRYNAVRTYSNYWEEVHPLLMEWKEFNFFLIAGDVGGNPDAISAFYDRWDHITLLASGMGEVADENYLLVHVHSLDSLSFELVALDDELELPDIEYYSVPEAPGVLSGPEMVFQGSTIIEYSVPEIFNAESYLWDLPQGATGSSETNMILVDFDLSFESGELSVRASRDGFGMSAATSSLIHADYSSVESSRPGNNPLQIKYLEAQNVLVLECSGLDGEALFFQIVDSKGRILKAEQYRKLNHHCEFQIATDDIPMGLYFVSVFCGSRHYTLKKIFFL